MTAAYQIIFVGAFASLLVHEFGHYVAARRLEIPIARVTVGVGPEILRIGARRIWRIRLIPIAGYTQYEPRAIASELQRAAILLAGPAANLLFGIAVLVVPAALAHGVPPIEEQLWRMDVMSGLWLVGAMSLAIGAFNLLPIPPLDGGALLLLLFGKVRGAEPNPNTVRVANTVGAWTLALLTAAVLVWMLTRHAP